MINSTALKPNITNKDELSLIIYDTNGAIMYIFIVLLWYSIGIVLLLGMNMLGQSEASEYSAKRRTQFLIENFHDHTKTKEILEELLDKQNRTRLWNIYLGTTSNKKDHLIHAETVRIRHIEKQLSTIKRNHDLTHETIDSLNTRNRSSSNSQTSEHWKEFTNRSKPYEQLPKTISKLMIRKYFRRNTKNLLTHQDKRSNTTIPTITTERTEFISFSSYVPELSHGYTESDLSKKKSVCYERQNPYISYFHIPSES